MLMLYCMCLLCAICASMCSLFAICVSSTSLMRGTASLVMRPWVTSAHTSARLALSQARYLSLVESYGHVVHLPSKWLRSLVSPPLSPPSLSGLGLVRVRSCC